MIKHYLRSTKIKQNKEFAPECPLKRLIKHIPAKYHSHFKTIQLSAELGIVSQREFSTLNMLAAYLGIYCSGTIKTALPYSKEIVPATNKVTIYTLMSHCKRTPSRAEMKHIIDQLPRGMK